MFRKRDISLYNNQTFSYPCRLNLNYFMYNFIFICVWIPSGMWGILFLQFPPITFSSVVSLYNLDFRSVLIKYWVSLFPAETRWLFTYHSLYIIDQHIRHGFTRLLLGYFFSKVNKACLVTLWVLYLHQESKTTRYVYIYMIHIIRES